MGPLAKPGHKVVTTRLKRPFEKHTMTQPISILLCALGGEGGGVLADWLVDV